MIIYAVDATSLLSSTISSADFLCLVRATYFFPWAVTFFLSLYIVGLAFLQEKRKSQLFKAV